MVGGFSLPILYATVQSSHHKYTFDLTLTGGAPSSRWHAAHYARMVIAALAIQSHIHRSKRLGNRLYHRHDCPWRAMPSSICRLGEVLCYSCISTLQVSERPNHHWRLPAVRNHVPIYLVSRLVSPKSPHRHYLLQLIVLTLIFSLAAGTHTMDHTSKLYTASASPRQATSSIHFP